MSQSGVWLLRDHCYSLHYLKGTVSAWLFAGVFHSALTALGRSDSVEPGCHFLTYLDMEHGGDCWLHCWLCSVVQTEGDVQVW